MVAGEGFGGNPGNEKHRAAAAPGDAGGVHSDPGVWGPRLERILDRQRDLFMRLDELSRSQRALIDDEQTDRLLELLARRQSLIDDIERTNEELSPFAGSWDRLATLLPEPRRRTLRDRFEEVSRLVETIAARDESDRALLAQRKQMVGEELRTMSRSRGAIAAYTRSGGPVDPVFKDEQG